MASSTYLQLKTKLENDLDLSEETFISATEMLGYFNEGVAMIEDEIHTLYEDYYLAPSATISLVSGTSAYSLPSDIYAQKIRALIYNDGSRSYEVRRIRKFADIPNIDANADYRFVITNSSTPATGYKLKLYPASRETSSTVMTIWYIRKANRFAVDADTCDIPEAFETVLIQYVRWKCRTKEGHPDTAQDLADLQGMKQKMIETLKDRVVDEDTVLTMDTSFYDDFDVNPVGGI
jgi:hypothetical protein